ncbi:Retrovirus-related Pol polyprotein from transposon 17.6, partial [Mucuna pruriens]
MFSVPCIIGGCTFVDAMLDLEASINVMPSSIYKSLNFGDLESTGITKALHSRRCFEVNELIFQTDFYVLDMVEEVSRKGFALILGRPFFMTARMKIDVHARTLSMEFGDNMVQFNIFEAIKHPAEDHSIFNINIINELVEEHMQICTSIVDFSNFVEMSDVIGCFNFVEARSDSENMSHKQDFPNSADNIADLVDQEEKLLNVLRKYKKAIGWTLADLPRISPSICMHTILLEEEARPIRQQQRRLNLTILDVVKKEVTKLLAVEIIYPISDSQWVSPVQVAPKKFGMPVMKNRHDEMVSTRIQNSWRVCIDYRKLNQETRKDHFPLPFIDQVYMQIHIAPVDQHKMTFTCPFGTFAYTRTPFGLCSTPSTFQRCMISIFLDLLEDCMEVFMDDFTVYTESFDACLENLSQVLRRCMDTDLVLNFEKCHFMELYWDTSFQVEGLKSTKLRLTLLLLYLTPPGSSLFPWKCRRFIKNFSKIALPLSKMIKKDVAFVFDQPCVDAVQKLKKRFTSTPIL